MASCSVDHCFRSRLPSVFLKDKMEKKTFPNAEVLVEMVGVGKTLCGQKRESLYPFFGVILLIDGFYVFSPT